VNNWKIGRRVGLTMLLVATIVTVLLLKFSVYSVEEGILVMFVVAMVVLAALLLLIAFVLLQEGVRLFMGWLKTKLVLSIGLNSRAGESLEHPPLRR
jgi:predicted membrane protein